MRENLQSVLKIFSKITIRQNYLQAKIKHRAGSNVRFQTEEPKTRINHLHLHK